MKKNTLCLILIFVFAYCVTGKAQTASPDSAFPATEKEKYQTQIDSLKCDLEKLRKEAYEKAIEGANRSLTASMMVLGFVALMVAILGVWGFFKARRIEREVKEELRKVEESKRDMEAKIKYECEKAEEERGKIAKVREEAEAETAGVRAIRREMVEISKDIKRVQQEIVEISRGMQKMYADMGSMKESIGESEKKVTAWTYYAEALKMVQEDKRHEASEKYRKAVELDPNFVEAYVGWGTNLYNLGELEGEVEYLQNAIEKSKKAIEIDPKSVTALALWGVALTEIGRIREDTSYYREAIEKYKKALETDPRDVQLVSNWGVALVEIGRLKKDVAYCEQAIEKYRHATQINPTSAVAYANWGSTLCEIGKLRNDERYFREGFVKFEEALRIDGNFAAGWYNKAGGHVFLKEKDQALQSLAKAIQLHPKYKWMAKTDEDFKDLWDDERFKELVG